MEPPARVDSPYPHSSIFPPPKLEWVRVWDDQPEDGDVVPIWDGQHIYYAAYWDIDGDKFFSILGDPKVNSEDWQFRKKSGEKIYPIEWIRLVPPRHP